MMASISLPVGESSACSVIDTTRTPFRRSMDLKATACQGGGGPAGFVDHLAELRAVGDASALGLVDVLAGDEVAVLVGVVPERTHLCGYGQVHVLSVAGHPGVEGCRCVVVSVVHLLLLLVSSCSVWRERRICIRSCLRHSLSSR